MGTLKYTTTPGQFGPRVIATKGDSTLPKTSELESRNQIQFSVMRLTVFF